MDSVLLPREVDLDKCISLKTVYENARLDLDLLPRFKESCVKIESDVLANLCFEVDLNGMRMIKGSVNAKVVLVCQRCFEEYVQELHLDLEFTPDYERAKACNLVNKYEFIELNLNNKLDLYELIEDGLILEIPSIPRHKDDAECGIKGEEWSYGEIPTDTSSSPFAALAALKENLPKH